jgi:MFS family permease
MGFGFSVFWLLLNLYLKQVGFEEGKIGSIISASSVGTVLVAIPAAVLIDRFRIKHVLMIAAVINGSALMTQAMSTTIWSLRAMSIISGAMWTVHFIAASPFFMRNSNPEERPYLFGVNMALSTVAGFIGSIVGGFVPAYLAERGVALLYGYRYTLMSAASLTAMALFAYLTIRSKRPARSGPFMIREYVGARDWKTVTKLMAPHFIIGMGAGLVIPFLNLYFLQRFELNSDAIGRIFSIGSLFTAAGFLVGPALAKRVGLVKTVVITQYLSIPFFLILAFSHNLYLSAIAFLFRGSLMNMAWPMYNNFAMELVPERDQVGTNSVLSLAWNASWMVSANLGGIMIEKSGFTVVMLATVGFYVTSTTAVWILFKSKSGVGRRKTYMDVVPRKAT